MSKPADIENIYPLSPLQAGLLFHTLLEPGSGIYFEQLTCELHGVLDEEAFANAWQLLAARHAILRTAFVWKGQREPMQVVHRSLRIPWRREDWRNSDGVTQKENLAAFLEEDRRRGFELNRAPLIRLATIRLADNLWQLVSSHHHILLDGWSFPLLLREFGDAYRAYCEGAIPRFAPVRPYSTYVAWLKAQDAAAAESFWRNEMRGFTEPTPLPLEHARGDRPHHAADGHRDATNVLSAADTDLLQASARESGVTLNTFVQGAWALVLSRYSGSADIVFGATVAGRPPELADVENIVGLFINTVPLRVQVPADARATAWLAALQDHQLAVRDFEYAGLADIQRWSDITPGQPLFESLVVFENYPIDASLPHKLGGLEPRAVSFTERTNYPLTLIAVPGDRLGLRASFDASRFDHAAVDRMLGHIVQALRGLSNGSAALGRIEIVSREERQAILSLASHQPAHDPETLHGWFAEQVRATPHATALTDSGARISYSELDARSNRLARRLAANGIADAGLVGLLTERGAALIVGILGILKCGAAYVPMDPIYPDDRIGWMISDAGIQVVVTQASLAARVSPATALCVDDAHECSSAPVEANVTPDHPAYVIYTSGSTGRPKGCLVTHRNVTRLFRVTEAWFRFGPSDVWTLFHSAAFDFSVWEIWGALLYGGRLVVVPYYTSREPEAFSDLVLREGVTVLNQTPSAFRQFMAMDERRLPGAGLRLRLVIFGGEALDLAALQPWFDRHGEAFPQLVNMYGITETTVHVTYRPITEADVRANRGSRIGIPLPDLRLIALDWCGHLAPVGIPGELFVAGEGLSPGYLNRPALTAERFVADPFGLSGARRRLYRTGDLARRLPDGDFEYLGRIDHQVKIRGFRIELGEIESELLALPGVAGGVVLMRDDRLIAWVVAGRDPRPTVEELRAGLRLRLPEYMVPSAFVWLAQLPLTPNGKLDRAALPSPVSDGAAAGSDYIPPRDERENILAEIWSDVLKVTRVGIRDNYFALGGDSIRSLAIRARARSAGIEFSLQDLFEKQTIEGLVSSGQYTQADAAPETPPTAPFSQIGQAAREALPADVEDAYPLTQLQLGMLFHSHERAGSSRYLDTFSFHLRGPLDLAALQAALDGLVERHAVLRTSFDLTALPEPLQRVHRRAPAIVAATDLAALSSAAQEAAIDSFVKSEAGRPFDWDQAPLFRVHLHMRGETFQFTLSAHHAILDGWSVASLLTELFHDYLRRLNPGGAAPAKLISPTFGDFVALERATAANPESCEFWRTLLAGAPVLRLPKPDNGSAGTVSLPIHVPAEVSAGLVRLAESLAVPLKTVLLTAHVRVLALVGGQDDVVTGVVSNGRPEASGADRLAGLFLNVLPLRVQLPQGSWSNAVSFVFGLEKAAMPHRRVPLADIQRGLGRGVLFHTDFNFVNFHVFDSLRGMDALQLVDTRSSEETNFALAANFSMEGASGSVHGSVSVDLGVVDESIAAALPALYNATLAALAKNAGTHWRATTVGPPETSPLPPACVSQVFPDHLLLHELVQAQADRTPDAVAVADRRTTLTYQQLDARANQVAHWLMERGVGPDSRVGVSLARSADLPVVMLGVLKAGGAWVPMDPDYPAARIAMLTRDSNAHLLLTEQVLEENARQIASQPDTRPSVHVEPEHTAYVIYTSGSTGTPKGVVIPHSAIVNHMLWMQQDFPLGASDVVLQKTPAGFDASVWEFWAPLMAGARLAMAEPGGHRDPVYLTEAVRRFGVTTLQLVPSMLDFFLEHASGNNCPLLKRVYSGGEALRPATRDRFFRQFDANLINLYGPTEAAIDSVTQICAREGEIAIGRPIANLQAWVLDSSLSPVPVGVTGELYLGGAGLARGYLNQPGLTAERFIPDPFSPWPGMRLYRTGDLVRQRADGTLFFAGRADDQVKVRGHRVEPGEIEAVLASAPGVDRAVVVVRGTGLVAYVALKSPTMRVERDVMFSFLRERLPAALVPAHLMFVEEFPLLPNGKLDRRALPEPEIVPRQQQALALPSTAVEAELAEMWRSVLGISEIGVDQNFFELGGDSIQSLRLVSLAARSGRRLRPRQIFDHPTIAALARIIEANAAHEAEQGPAVDVDRIPLLPVQRAFFALNAPNPHHWNQAVLVQVPPGLSAETAERAWLEVTSRHPAFRLRFAQERMGWRQFLLPAAECPFATARLADIERVAAEAHSSLNICSGPTVRSIFFPSARWLIVAHHLAVDGVSWRILLEELALACESKSAIVPEEVSFASWATRLSEEARSPRTLAEARYWRGIAGDRLAPDFPEGLVGNTEASADSVRWSLDEQSTRKLLRFSPGNLRCSVEELLLTALAAALGSAALVDLEGHGREDSILSGDLSRTIGWFTTVYPVRLPDAADSWERLRGVKDALRSVPRRGIGYGLLHPDSESPSDVSFNYLGQIDLALSAAGPFRPAHESTGRERAPDTRRSYLIDVVAMVSGGCLQCEWLYSTHVHRTATIEAAAQRFAAELQFLLSSPDPVRAITGSDFPLAGFDRALIAGIVETSPPLEDIWPLTPLQEGMLVHSLHEDDSGVYGQQVCVDLHGPLDLNALKTAWTEVVRRHEVMRVEFRWQDLPAPRQLVRREMPVDIEVLNCPNRDGQNDDQFRDWLAADRARGFDLANGPLWRITVFQFGEDRWRMVWSHHHLLLDGWSLPIVFRRLTEEYAHAAGAAPVRRQDAFRHASYLAWLTHRDATAEAAFWKDALAGYKPAAGLEIGSPPPTERTRSTARGSVAWELTPAATASLRALSQSLRITLGTCIQAVWGLALARWTGQAETVFGLVVAGRPAELPGVETAVGMFINTLPLRVRAPRRQPVGQWLKELHNQTAALRQFEHSRLVDVQSWSDIPRGQQLFEAVLIIENYPLDASAGQPVAGVRFGKVDTFEQTSLPLNLYAVPGESLELRLEYAPSRFGDEVMRALAASVAWLLESLPAHVADPPGTMSLVAPVVPGPSLSIPAGKPADRTSVHDRISAQAERRPQAIAVAPSLTYAELDTRSSRLANCLRKAGAGPGTLVGVCLNRTPDLVVALTGILKCGAAYVPMDPAFPVERLAMMVEDSNLTHVITNPDVGIDAGLLPDTIVRINPDAGPEYSCEPLHYSSDPDELAYVIFTSGSTGRPKGVQVTHGALANFLSHFALSPGMGPADTLLAVTTLSFDIAALELFLPLVCGATVVIATREEAADARALAERISASGANVMQATPATWRLLLSGDWQPPPGFHAWCGGEALPIDLARDLLARGVRLWNFYGPTETTIWSSTQPVTTIAEAAFIGRPIAETTAWVLDENFNPVPPGMTGELYLGGAGLARGYIGKPALTAERFVPDPFGYASRLYATGDRARWEAGGVLAFLGRGDHQVKIRGFRIELEEIEQALRALPAVRGAVVAARNDHQGNPRLVAWVRGLGDAGGPAVLRAALRERLPDYMIPAAFVEIDALPLTPNGKLDRRALPELLTEPSADMEFVAPRDPLELVLADLWKEVLGADRVGARGHFFELGGHSLLAAQALGRIRKYFQVDLSLRTFFQTATPETVAAALKAAEHPPGRMLAIAAALRKVRSMTPEEKALLRERANRAAAPTQS